MTTAPGIYQACLVHASVQGGELMKGMIGSARQRIFARVAESGETQGRSPLHEALRLLNHHEAFLCQRFPELLLAEFDSTKVDEAARSAVRVVPSFDQLELMDDVQVQERVEIARILQASLQAVDVELEELNRLICGAQGLPSVIADRNPMRPEVYARALRAVLMQTQEAPAMRVTWMQYLGATLGEALASTYRELCQKLRDAGVAPAGYLVLQGQGGARGGAVPSGGASRGPQNGVAEGVGLVSGWGRIHGSDNQSAGTGPEEKLLTLEHLRSLLAGELGGADAGQDGWASPGAGGRPLVGNAFSHTVPAAFDALHEMKQVDAVIKRLADRKRAGSSGVHSPEAVGGARKVRESHRDGPRTLGQALAREVVSQMIDNIAGDFRLLEPVRIAIKSLEPALLGLALEDPRFFSDRKHPARRLLDDITQRSLGFDTVDADGFDAFLQPIQSAVRGLVSIEVDGPEPFEVALIALNEEWTSQAARAPARRQKAVQALLQAEQRNMLASQLVRELRERADLQDASPDVVAFLVGPWSQVMAHARLSHPAQDADPGGFGAVVSDLLWSAHPDLARRNRAALARMIPGLIGKLREGLESINYPATRSDVFFDVLMGLHQQALASLASQGDAPPAAASRPDLAALFDDVDETGVWLVGDEARDSGFLEDFDAPDSGIPSSFEPTAPMDYSDSQSPLALPASPEAAFDAMVLPGAWIELWVQGRWIRSQLTWSSPQGKLFMYTSVSGGAHSMTRRSLKRLFDEGTVRLIAGQTLVDGALDAVAQRALRNSLDINL